jgi:hypothetical protein
MSTARVIPTRSSAVVESLRILLSDAIDYAGLFPPASLGMPAAAGNFARYLQGEFGWMLGRFVVPAERLMELEKLLKPNRARGWRVTALMGRNFKDDLKSIVQFHLKTGERAHVDAVEFKIATKDEINPILELLPHGIDSYAEVALRDDLAEQIEAIRMARLKAKVRTGGVNPGAFPRLQQVARFIAVCASAGVPFKATAGLHHPLRGVYAMTAAERGPHAPMHGFLNILLAAAAIKAGAMELQLPEILALRDGQAIAFHKDGVKLRNLKLTNRQLRETREQLAVAFGSCSFEDPIRDLEALKLL